MPAVMPAWSWSPAERGTDHLDGDRRSSKVIGRAPYLRLVARVLALALGEVAADLRRAVGDDRLEVGGVEITWPSSTIANCLLWSPAIACESLRWVVGALAVELDVDRPLHLALAGAGRARGGGVDLGALDEGRREEELVALVVTGDQRQRRVVDHRRRRRAGEGVVDRHRLRVGVGLPRQSVFVGLLVRRCVVHLAGRVGDVATGAGRRRRARARAWRSPSTSSASGSSSCSCSGPCRAAPAGGSCRWASGWPWTSTGSGSTAGSPRRRATRRTTGSGAVVVLCGTCATRRNRSCAWRSTVSTRLLLRGAGHLDDDLVAALGGDRRLGDPRAVDAAVDDAGGLLEVLGGHVGPLAVRVIWVPPSRSRPSAGFQVPIERDQAVGERQTDEEHRDGASRSSASCVPSTASPQARQRRQLRARRRLRSPSSPGSPTFADRGPDDPQGHAVGHVDRERVVVERRRPCRRCRTSASPRHRRRDRAACSPSRAGAAERAGRTAARRGVRSRPTGRKGTRLLTTILRLGLGGRGRPATQGRADRR